MDAIAQLALMHKAQKVFGGAGTFLSFPVTPLQYTQTDLSFVQNFNVSRLKEFSLLVNLIPTGEAWQPTEARYLWDSYGEVLAGQDTELAQSTRTPQEEAQYQAAVQFLTVIGGNGWPEPSPAMKLYAQFRDQGFMLQEKYNAAKLTGTTATDPALQEHWQQVEEPQLSQQIRDLNTRWVNEGFKQEVEQAQEVRSRLGAKNPNRTWGEWNSKFNPDIYTLTDTDAVQFYPSSFSPINAMEAGSWQTFTLAEGEVEAMVREAPAELRSRLAADLQTSEIESISLEFSSAAIVRTWLNSDLFKARFWRFGDRAKHLSNGQTPPSGSCPAYVSALVFARNITIKRKSQPTQGQPSTVPGTTPLVAEKLEFSQAVQVLGINPKLTKVTPVTPITPSHLDRRPIVHQPVSPISPTLNAVTVKPNLIKANLAQAMPAQSLKASPSTARPINTRGAVNLSAQLRNVNLQPLETKPPLTSANRAIAPELASHTFLRLQQEAVLRPTLPTPPTTHQVPKEPTKTVETKTPPDHIYILAFICKPLPLSPNPDPTLPW